MKNDKEIATCDSCEVKSGNVLRTETQGFFYRVNTLKVLTLISGLLLIAAFSSSSIAVKPLLSTTLYLLSLFTGSLFVVRSAIRGLFKQRFLNISFLVVIAALGAIYIGEFAEAAAVVFLFTLAELFESYGVERSRRAVASLIDKSPKIARLLDGNTLPVEEVSVGTIVVVKPGEQIPLDGVVVCLF